MLRYAITNRAAGVGGGGVAEDPESGAARLLENVRRWAAGGVEYVQVRERGVAKAELLRLGAAVMAARDAGARDAGARDAAMAARDAVRTVEVDRRTNRRTRVLIHTSVEIALAVGADGVHLPGSWSLPEVGGAALEARVAEIRQKYRLAGVPEPTVSVSCHSVEEVRTAGAAGVDLLLFGPVFGKVIAGETVRPGVGLGILGQACEAAAGVPVLALGGVTWQNAGECLRAGAAGVAGIRLFEAMGDEGYEWGTRVAERS